MNLLFFVKKNHRYLFLLLGLMAAWPAAGQAWWEVLAGKEQERSGGMLLKSTEVKIDATEAINHMYGYNFVEAEKEFRWLQQKYPEHPLSYFLFGLAEWWKIVTNTDTAMYDGRVEAYMDRAIDKAEKLYDMSGPASVEGAFFLSAAYAFKGRLYAERKKWVKAANAGRNSLKYLEKCRGQEDLSPELLFGDGLYNYYREWVPENYGSLKPIFLLFKKGNKALGINQLEKVGNFAFYTRTEAQYFLLQIYGMENQHEKGYQLARYLHTTYPWNPYFHRMYARQAFITGRMQEAETSARQILERLANKQFGYEGASGRYASYILGYYSQFIGRDLASAKNYYQKTVEFARNNNAEESGYSVSALLNLGRICLLYTSPSPRD